MTRVKHFYDQVTSTFTYVVSDAKSGLAAIVDPVLNLDYASGTLGTRSADEVVKYIRDQGLSLPYILETHIHADHLSSAPYIRERLGGEIVIGAQITTVQETFATIFAESEGFLRDGSQFDLMLSDGDTFALGDLEVLAFHVPGHTRVFVCHDYQPGGRDLAFESTVAEQRAHNIRVGIGISADEFVAMREARDEDLEMPTLILPSLQVNMRAGNLPPIDASGRLFLKVPINAFGGAALDRFASEA